jgi:hypothetical protein
MEKIIKEIKKTNWTAIELDQTEYWRDDIKKACGKIMTVYVYDKSVHIHCCEGAPSYYLIPVYSYPIYPNHVYDMPDKEREEYMEKYEDDIRQGDADDSPAYYHVSNIDKIDEKYKKSLDVNIKFESANSEKYLIHQKHVEDHCYEHKPFI